MSWHSILGVGFDAGYADIRAAFKRRVLEAHPDKGGSAQEFQQIMLAFERATCAVPTESSSSHKTHVGPSQANAANSTANMRTRGPFTGWFSRVSQAGGKSGSVRQPWDVGAAHAKHNAKQQTTHTTTPPRGRLGHGKQSTLRQLHACLQRLPREDRQVALRKHLKQRHRLALEAWITSTREQEPPRPTPSSRTSERTMFVRKGVKHPQAAVGENEEVLLAITDVAEHFEVEGIEGVDGVDADVLPDRRQRLQKGIIKRQGRASLYFVLVVVSNIELFSAGTADLASAVDLHIALTALKRQIAKQPALMDRLDEEVVLALQEQDITTSQARLRLRIHFPVHHWTGRGLRSPTYSWAEVSTALAVWKKLQHERLEYTGLGAKKGGVYFLHTPASVERAWQMISETYIEAWGAAGWDKQDLQAKLDAMRNGHATSNSCQLTAWNQYRMECEDRRQRLLERVMRQCEARERRELAKEDRRAAQIQAKSNRLLFKIDRLIACLEARPAKKCHRKGVGTDTPANKSRLMRRKLS